MYLVNPVRKTFLLGVFLLLSALAATAQSHVWLPLDPKDLQMKEFKQLPGAEAVLLYYQNEIDDVSHTEFFYSRIKVPYRQRQAPCQCGNSHHRQDVSHGTGCAHHPSRWENC